MKINSLSSPDRGKTHDVQLTPHKRQRSVGLLRNLLFILFCSLASLCCAQTEGDEIMKMLLAESQAEAEGILETNSNLRSVEVEAQDGILIYNYIFKKGKLNQPQSQDEIDILKSSLIKALKANFDDLSEDTESESEAYYTPEELFEYLKGFRFVYIEENTLKGFQIDISTDEIRSSKLVVRTMDETSTEKFKEHLEAEHFAHDIAKTSKELCPMVSGGMIIDSMVYDYKNLHYYIHIDSMEQVAVGTSAIKNGIRNQMVFAGGESNIFTLLAKLDGGWLLHFRVLNTDSTFTISFSPEEIKEMVIGDNSLNEKERARYSLNSVIETTNAQLPKLLDFMTRLDTMYIDGNHLVYQYTVLSNFEMVKENRATVEWTLRSQLMSQDVTVTYLTLMCVRSGYGICHRYVPLATDTPDKKKAKKQKKSEVVEFCFSVEDLKGYVKE